MTKAAISHLTKCLAVEWGPHGITVNAVAPTFIVTPGTAAALDDPVIKADILERIAALHRVGDPIGRGGRGGVPRVTGGGADHGPHHPDRRRLDGALSLSRRRAGAADGRAAPRTGGARRRSARTSTSGRARPASPAPAMLRRRTGSRDAHRGGHDRCRLKRCTLRHRNATWASRYTAGPPSSAAAGTSVEVGVHVRERLLEADAPRSTMPATIGKWRYEKESRAISLRSRPGARVLQPPRRDQRDDVEVEPPQRGRDCHRRARRRPRRRARRRPRRRRRSRRSTRPARSGRSARGARRSGPARASSPRVDHERAAHVEQQRERPERALEQRRR